MSDKLYSNLFSEQAVRQSLSCLPGVINAKNCALPAFIQNLSKARRAFSAPLSHRLFLFAVEFGSHEAARFKRFFVILDEKVALSETNCVALVLPQTKCEVAKR